MKKFEPPLDENGKPYWIPVVIKNLDYLRGFLHSYSLVTQVFELPIIEVNKLISSDRFNDVLLDGTRIRDITDKELKSKVETMIFSPGRSEHPENTGEIYEENILTIDCVGCGMHYSYKDVNVLPAADFKCECCGRSLIVYTGEEDSEFYYDGYTKDQINDIVTDLHKNFLSSDDSEEEDQQ